MSNANQKPVDAQNFLDSVFMSPAMESVDVATERYEEFLAVADRYRNDGEFRDAIDGGSEDALAAFGMESPGFADMEARVVANTDELQHFILPPDPNANLTDEQLGRIAGGGGESTLSTAGTLSTALCSTLPSTTFCAGSIGSVSPT